MATPQDGNHHDLYDIQPLFEELCALLEAAGIDLKGVFMNADSGFDAQGFRRQCAEKAIEANIDANERNKQLPSEENYVYFDDLLYERRFVVERMNAWIDSFKALLIRFETLIKTWMALHFLAFTVLLCRKIPTVKL